jgi:hypothetical protein
MELKKQNMESTMKTYKIERILQEHWNSICNCLLTVILSFNIIWKTQISFSPGEWVSIEEPK